MDLQAELAELLALLKGHMREELFDQASEFVEHGEYGLAYEWIEIAFSECAIPRDEGRDNRLVRIGEAIGMPSAWLGR